MEQNHAKEQAKLQLESILEYVKRLEHAEEEVKCLEKGDCDTAEEYHDDDKAREAVQVDALSVRVRDDWHGVGEESTPTQYELLLCFGGPSVRMVGTLDKSQADTAVLQYQDWGTPWTDYPLTSEQEEACIKYANCFYFGDF